MWLLNVVAIITFMFFIINVILKVIKQKEIYLYVIVILSIIFGVIYIVVSILNISLPTFIQILVLIFSYLIPMGIFALDSSNVTFRLKILYAISKLAYSFKKYELSAGLMFGAIRNDKKNYKYYYLRGKSLEKLGDLASARDMLFKVIELDRGNKNAYMDLVGILDRENKKDTALVMLAQLLKIYPDDVEAKEMLGMIYADIGRFKEAESIYEEIIKLDKATYNTYYNLGIMYWRNNELDKAINMYNVAIGMNNKLYEAYYLLGKLYFKEENYEQSIYNLEKVLKDRDLKVKAMYCLAMNYIKKADYEKAINYLNEASKIDLDIISKARLEAVFEPIYDKMDEFYNLQNTVQLESTKEL